MDSAVENNNPFPRILWWEVFNFMSIAHGRADFDEKNIINFKGYNDSGKSAMLTALKVAISNCNPSKQVGFIKDDTDYFRVMVVFEGNIVLLRDKYINGQSLYELYKDDKCIYTSKSSTGALTKISGVPQPIADFLGLVMYDDICLNSRSCFEKQIGVQTTGSENYKMFNTVLKSEEIASAGALLNNDKNKLVADINKLESDIQANKELVGVGKYLSEDMISYLKDHDNKVDEMNGCLESIQAIRNLSATVDSIHIYDELSILENKQLSDLISIKTLIDTIAGIPDIPIVHSVDMTALSELKNISIMLNGLNSIKSIPEVSCIDVGQLSDLINLSSISDSISICDTILTNTDNEIKEVCKELSMLEEQLKSLGIKTIKCPNCGTVFNETELN